jgi:hypothetical protein
MEKDTKVNKNVRYYAIFAVHSIFIGMWLTSPFWLPWPLLIMLSLLLYFQSRFLGYCVATRWQFGSKDVSFWVYYLGQLGLAVTKDKITRYTRMFLFFSPIIGFVWQTWVR